MEKVMLVEFRVRNFRSIMDEQVFSMVASTDKDLPQNTTKKKKFNLLKSASIYGANASGKSNLLQAINFMKFFIKISVSHLQEGEAIPVEPFLLNSSTEDSLSLFEMTFFVEETRYRYGFEISKEKIVNEWLFYVPSVQEKELFWRNGNEIKTHPDINKEAKGLKEKTRNNALFLSVLAQFNSQIAKDVMKFFNSLIVIHGDISFFAKQLSDLVQDKTIHDAVKAIINGTDLQIQDFRCEEEELNMEEAPDELKQIISTMKEKPKKYEFYTDHRKLNAEGEQIGNVELMLNIHESEGTKQVFWLAGPLIQVLSKGGTLVVDELDNSLHPLILEMIVGLFNSEKNTKAQLIFSTHNTRMLTKKYFRRDQIWFAEKNRYYATELSSLYDFSVRKDASYDKDYLSGKYGAIPYLQDITESFYGN